MNAPDWTVISRMKDAQEYSDQCNEAERRERIAVQQEKQLNAILDGIRKCDMTRAQAHQILATLASALKNAGFSEDAIEAVDTASEQV